jgi:hypothetical protein
MFGYYWVLIFFISINIFALMMNMYLYHIDIKYHDGILNKVDKGDKIEDLMTSPAPNTRKDILRQSLAKTQDRQALADYKLDKGARDQLKRSMARSRPN